MADMLRSGSIKSGSLMRWGGSPAKPREGCNLPVHVSDAWSDGWPKRAGRQQWSGRPPGPFGFEVAVKCEHLIKPMGTGHDERRRIDKTQSLAATVQEQVLPFLVQVLVYPHHLHQGSERPSKGADGFQPEAVAQEGVRFDEDV